MAMDANKMARVAEFIKALDVASQRSGVMIEGGVNLAVIDDEAEAFPLTVRYGIDQHGNVRHTLEER